MNKKSLFLSTLLIASSISGIAQIMPSMQTPVGIHGPVNHTGLAVAPAVDIYAAVMDDGSGNYTIKWLDATGTVDDVATNPGEDPDVAYYHNADLVFVAYENGGNVYVDDYYLTTITPTINYNFSSTTNAGSGTHANIDWNSMGFGVLCYEDAGTIYARRFGTGVTLGPAVAIGTGTKPDVVLLDNSDEIVITYIQGTSSVVEKYDFWALGGGSAVMTAQWIRTTIFPNYFDNPRVAADRNANFGTGSLDNFTVVCEHSKASGGDDIVGFFWTSGAMYGVHVNNGVDNCENFVPVVTYERDLVKIAWASNSGSGCASVPGGLGDNVLISEHKFDGTPIAPGVFREVNDWSNGFVDAAPSISAEYDGGYTITNSNYHEAIIFDDWGDLLWKARNTGTAPFYKQAAEEESTVFTLTSNPAIEYIEVNVNHTEAVDFTLFDNVGRRVMTNSITNSGSYYQIDIKHLPKGIYYLNCTAGTTTETIKVVH